MDFSDCVVVVGMVVVLELFGPVILVDGVGLRLGVLGLVTSVDLGLGLPEQSSKWKQQSYDISSPYLF